LTRTAEAIDVNTRTLLTEIDVDNPKGELLAGSYCVVHLKLPTPATTLKLPVNAFIFRSDGLQVATVGSDNRVLLHSVTVGRDFGTSLEVISGIGPDDLVVVNPPDSLAAGTTVRPVTEDKNTEGRAQ
jgi:multidrug efflux pump subunit AcrA (membrane-fusion protein)